MSELALDQTEIGIDRIAHEVEQIVRELVAAGAIAQGQIIVFGTSTSEVIGHHIGTYGTEDVAAHIFRGIQKVRDEVGFFPAFQCCEHLNRALVVDRELMEKANLDEVAVIPMPQAGGSMAAYAYRHLTVPAVVETINAHAGVDIGETLIGMHLRRVAVPFRPSVRMIGKARVTTAYTRPKLIGGVRAVYTMEMNTQSDSCE